MNEISDKYVILIILITTIFIFALIFSVKSPERKIIESPIMWKDEYIKSSINKIYVEDNYKSVKYSF